MPDSREEDSDESENEWRTRMTSNKMFVVMVATMMVAVTGAVMLSSADEVPAMSNPTGAYNVYYYSGDAVTGYEWKVQPAATYDLFQAVQEASTALGFTYTADTAKTWGSGYDINPSPTYGTIYTINNSTDFTIFVYDNRASVANPYWETAQPALGWYRCFADYAGSVYFPSATYTFGATAGAANVAIVPGTYTSMPDATKAGADLQPTGMQSLTAITQDAEYGYVFYIKDTIGTSIVATGTYATYYDTTQNKWVYGEINSGMLKTNDGLRVRGYGSDVYQALKNAIGLANISVQLITWIYYDQGTPSTSDDYYTYYSWYTLLFGQGTLGPYYGTDEIGNYSRYIYWEAETHTGYYLEFNPGYYSKLNGAIGVAESIYDYTYLESIYHY